MKITLVTIRVPSNPYYDEVTRRWLETYLRFKPEISHELVVVDSDSSGDPGSFADHASRFMVYKGGGWDCGTWLHVSREIETDLLVCCNSSTYFVRDGWMERFAEEFGKHGDGLYGPMASLSFFPHIRTPCMVFPPRVGATYPHSVNDRDSTYRFECLGGPQNFTLWAKSMGYQTRMVTWDGSYDMPEWRKPNNVFWKGDQSNLLVKDRHARAYENSSPEVKARLEKEADGPVI